MKYTTLEATDRLRALVERLDTVRLYTARLRALIEQVGAARDAEGGEERLIRPESRSSSPHYSRALMLYTLYFMPEVAVEQPLIILEP